MRPCEAGTKVVVWVYASIDEADELAKSEWSVGLHSRRREFCFVFVVHTVPNPPTVRLGSDAGHVLHQGCKDNTSDLDLVLLKARQVLTSHVRRVRATDDPSRGEIDQ